MTTYDDVKYDQYNNGDLPRTNIKLVQRAWEPTYEQIIHQGKRQPYCNSIVGEGIRKHHKFT